jgi:hypothetical protein
MMTRSATTAFAGRATTMRRLRRRASAATAASRTYCRTNGCTSFLEIDPATGVESCPICGYVRRTH